MYDGSPLIPNILVARPRHSCSNLPSSHIMASSSNNRGDGPPNFFAGRSSNIRAFEQIHDEDENVDFSGDDGDDDDEDLNDYGARPPFGAAYGETYYPGVNMCIVSTHLVEFTFSEYSVCCCRFAKKDRRTRETGKVTLLAGCAAKAYSSA